MFSQWPSWLSRSPRIRRFVIKLWRVFLRVQRSTFANAVLVVRQQDGRVLALPSTSGELRLPLKQLDGWTAVTTQVEEWLEQLLEPGQTPKLVAIDGTPGRQGVTFLYSAEVPSSASDHTNGVWLEVDVPLPTLNSGDRRLLLLSKGESRQPAPLTKP
jgi:hypothetical protein